MMDSIIGGALVGGGGGGGSSGESSGSSSGSSRARDEKAHKQTKYVIITRL